jgi:DNA-3-methyladenine glycosylase I
MTRRRCAWAEVCDDLRRYHDEEYGRGVTHDRAYFERLVLEIFQAGLSWRTILAKRSNFQKAFAGFDFAKVARFKDPDKARLLSDRGIVRNRRKIDAVVENAARFARLVDRHGSFHAFIGTLPLDDRPATVKAFRANFLFMGPTIVEEFLMSTGHWPVSHEPHCFLHHGSS